MKILHLQRRHLIDSNKNFESIRIFDFKKPMNIIHKAALIIFIDNNGKTQILKNRWRHSDIVG